jgi:hypothetical protein
VFRDDSEETAREEWQLLCEAVAALVQVLHTATRYPLLTGILCARSLNDVSRSSLLGTTVLCAFFADLQV